MPGLRWTDAGAKEILDLRYPSSPVALGADAGDDLRLLSASGDGSHVFVITNRGGDLTRLESVGLTSGDAKTIASDPQKMVDVSQVVMDAGTSAIQAVGYTGESVRWQAVGPEFAPVMSMACGYHRCGDLIAAEFSADNRRCLLKSSSSLEPGTIRLSDSDTRRALMLWQEMPNIDRASLCETKQFAYTARDGTRIPAFLTTPHIGKPPWPLVVFPHGGPHMRTFPGFDGRVQFFASRGYAVLQPNYRGSRGYGKRFMNAADGQWGTGVIQSDISDGVTECERRGIADKGRVAIFGGSYGGYAALAGLAFTRTSTPPVSVCSAFPI